MVRLLPERCLGLDVGERRIGVAAGSVEAGLARPLETIEHTGDERRLARRLRELVNSERAGVVVVGDPLNMDGSVGKRSEASRQFADWLGRAVRQVRVELQDERLSSFTADESMERDGVPASKRKGLRDAYAAAVILQDYLDAARDEGHLVS